MAEETGAPKAVGTPPVKKGGIGNRLIYLIGGVIFFVIILIVGFFFRPSFDSSGGQDGRSKYVNVFTHLELKDAAEIRAALDAQGIRDYKVEENGKTIAVRRKDADNARLAMALEGLPAGGVVGYEIFDKGGALGATDFDKRIKLTRALNGELSRNISRIYGIEEARVQIVIPEKQLFETEKVPVTSAVFIKIAKGILLSPLQIKGVIHLIASSVEELATRNVTVVDYSGRILSSPEYEDFYNKWKAQQQTNMAISMKQKPSKAEGVKLAISVEETQKSTSAALTPKERMEARLRFKQKFEKDMEAKAQSVLDQFFPAGASLIKINAELKTFDEAQEDNGSAIARITSIILLDENNKTLVLTPENKEAVFKAVAAVTGYVRGRDRIDLRWAPIYEFGRAGVFGGAGTAEKTGLFSRIFAWATTITRKILVYGIFLALFLMIANAIRKSIFRKKLAAMPDGKSGILSPGGRGGEGLAGLKGPTLDDFKQVAENSPDKLAEVLKNWLSE
ncbi:flagellar basal-body MS-ring/collar protein FliF [Candidatus Margulisiibacteriota bacterium]